ncbi:MAG: DUF2442 domain-containing protein [Verrucomicrobia bacterium]|nr:DUF2442 domain-containing protein [Verrucomicrobiota bacterium]
MNVGEIKEVHLTEDRLGFELQDGRRISVPLSFYPTLQRATREARLHFEVYPFSVYWPDLDCDIGIEGLLEGAKELPAYVARAQAHRDRSEPPMRPADAAQMLVAEPKPRYGVK